MTNTFISYMREDWETVRKIADEITSAGVDVWIDKYDIDPGNLWRPEVEKAIKRHDFFIPCYSTACSTNTDNGMITELRIAITLLNEKPRGWLLPVMLEQCDVPPLSLDESTKLLDIHYIPLYESWRAGIDRLLDVLLGVDRLYEGIPAELKHLIHHHIRALYLKFPEERLRAASELGKIPNAVRPATPHLCKVLNNDASEHVKTAAATALASLHAHGKEVNDSLAEAIKQSIPESFKAILLLGEEAISDVYNRDPGVFRDVLKKFVRNERQDFPPSLAVAVKRLKKAEREQLYKSIDKDLPARLAAFGALAVADLVEEMEKTNVKQQEDLEQIEQAFCSIADLPVESVNVLPKLLNLARQRINEWAGDRNYPRQYEDQIDSYFCKVVRMIQHVACSAAPSRRESIKNFFFRTAFERDPERDQIEYRYYIDPLHELEALIADLIPPADMS